MLLAGGVRGSAGGHPGVSHTGADPALAQSRPISPVPCAYVCKPCHAKRRLCHGPWRASPAKFKFRHCCNCILRRGRLRIASLVNEMVLTIVPCATEFPWLLLYRRGSKHGPGYGSYTSWGAHSDWMFRLGCSIRLPQRNLPWTANKLCRISKRSVRSPNL
ncbi:hypothetical protein BD779DRAFT_677564 [Infundibulicybe gibba]|nr:hypothetical protein BD779DRAFT_677564 [Infundibulicybe gibba]